MDDELAQIKSRVRRELADFLGTDQGDIEDESTLREDLHMSSAELTDFLEILKTAGFDVEAIDLTQIETFTELVEGLSSHI
ncbi:MAG TPA: phosphopantetheine-binding protein [Patescibacteria group bacterium]|nr:phosphopantetheine-binding protein [Patescibacteria group bacterium]